MKLPLTPLLNVDKIKFSHQIIIRPVRLTKQAPSNSTLLDLLPIQQPILLTLPDPPVEPLEPPKPERRKKKNSPWRQYKRKVWLLTEAVAHLIPGIETRGFQKNHIDHMVSLSYGFKHNIPAEEIAHLNNLRMLPHRENMKKGRKCVFIE